MDVFEGDSFFETKTFKEALNKLQEIKQKRKFKKEIQEEFSRVSELEKPKILIKGKKKRSNEDESFQHYSI